MLGRSRVAMTLVSAFALSAGRTQQAAAVPAPVVVAVPVAAAAGATRFLRSTFGDQVVVDATAATGTESPAGAQVLLFFDEWTLARLAAVGALEPLAQPESWFDLPFTHELVVVGTNEVLPADRTGLDWDELALHPALHDRLGIVAPEVDGAPWLSAMQSRLLRGERADAGVAVWTTLDARAFGLASSYAQLQAGLVAGTLVGAIGPRTTMAALAEGSGGRLRLGRLGGENRARFGLAVTAAGDRAAHAVASRLRDPAIRQELAAAAGMTVAPPTDAPALDGPIALAFWNRFESDVRGRGRGIERLADGLDIVFGSLFVVCAWFVWRSLRGQPVRAPRDRVDAP